jgi:hypothetical protein
MTQKNLKLVRRVLNSEVWGRVINCPDALMRQARSMNDRARVKAAMTAQIATAVAIVTAAPVRAANLAAIRLGENLVKPGGPDTPYLLVFPDPTSPKPECSVTASWSPFSRIVQSA